VSRDEDKKRKIRTSQSVEDIKLDVKLSRSGSISDTSLGMHQVIKNGCKKRKPSAEDDVAGNKKSFRRNNSITDPILREPLNTALANAAASSHPPHPQTAPARTESRPALFPTVEEDPTGLADPMDQNMDTIGGPDFVELTRSHYVKSLRENNRFGGPQTQDPNAHVQIRSNSVPEGSPITYSTCSSPVVAISLMHNSSFVEVSNDYPDTRPNLISVSTPTTLMSTPPPVTAMVPLPFGEDPRNLDLPNRAMLENLADAYFANVYSQTYAFLHRATFMENMHKHPPVLLFSMCAVAARFSEHAKLDEEFARRARDLIVRDYDSYSLEMVQSMIHMGLHDFGSNNGHKAWMFCGMAVRMGAALNMNLENRKNWDKEKTAISRESHRRTYWSYFVMDVSFFLPTLAVF
jgi:hypothetical protein